MAEVPELEGDFDVVKPDPKVSFTAPTPHDKDGGVLCDVCGRSFGTVRGLRRHRSGAHPEQATGPSHVTPAARNAKLQEQADAFCLFFYDMGGSMLSNVDPVCGPALKSCRSDAAIAWAKAAQVNPTVAKMLGSVESVSVWGALLTAHLPLLEAVRQHHLTRSPTTGGAEPVERDDDGNPQLIFAL